MNTKFADKIFRMLFIFVFIVGMAGMPNTRVIAQSPLPELTLEKSASPTTYTQLGDIINYSYVLTNTGSGTLSGPFTVTDDKTTVTCPGNITPVELGNTVLFDHFENGNLAQYASGTPDYVSGQNGFGQAADFSSGAWLRYNVPGWYLWPTTYDPTGKAGSIDFWVYPKQYNIGLVNLNWNYTNTPPSAGHILHIDIDSNGKLTGSAWSAIDGPPLTQLPAGNTTISLNQWTHVAYTWGADGTRLYVNGVQDAYSPDNLYPALSSANYIYVPNWGVPGIGYIDDLRITTSSQTNFGVAALAPGESLTCNGSYTITQNDVDNQWLTNTAQAHAFFGSAPLESMRDIATVTIGEHLQVKTNFDTDEIQVWGLANGTSIALSIDGPGVHYSTTKVIEPLPWDPNQLVALFQLQGVFDILPGYVITVTGAGQSKTMTVANIWGISIDVDADTVSGYIAAGSGAKVHVGENIDSGNLPVDENGHWIADLSLVGTDLKPGSRGHVQVDAQDGGTTWIGFQVLNPIFNVRANNDQIETWEWNVGSTITVKIYASGTETPPADYTTSDVVTGPTPWGDTRNYLSFNLSGNYDIKPGYLVTVSDGNTTKKHIVTSLAFDVMDVDADTVSGFAEPGSNVDIWACDNSNCYNRHVATSDPGGTWFADWHVPGQGDENNTFDLVRGTWVDSSQYDEDGDSTMFGQNIPNPYVEASPTGNWVHARDWPIGTLVTMNISGSSQTYTATMAQTPWNPNDTVADFDLQGYDIQAGDVITASGNGTTKTLTISQLAITSFDLEADTLSGTGTAGVQIQVCANVPNRCITRWVTAAGGSGAWTANYHDPGSGNDDPDTFNIQQGSNGWAAEYEADSDRTWLDWSVADPRMDVSYEHDWIQIYDFTPGGEVTYTIYDHPGGHALFGPVTGPVDSHGNGWISSNLFHTDLIPGNYITAVNEATGEEVSVLIRNVNLDYIGADDDRVFGTGEPNATLQLNISTTHDQGFNLTTNVNSSGYWEVDLAAQGHPIDRYRYASANLYDAEGDSIIAQSPWVDAQISTDSFGVTNFSKNADVTFTLYESSGGAVLYGPVTLRTEGSGSSWVNLWGQNIDLVPGYYITAYDHTLDFTKSLEVEPFDFVELNAAEDYVSGTAAIGEWVDLHVESMFSNWGLDSLTDGNGQWFRDYGVENYDITEQMWANGWATDDQGNRSHDNTTGLPGIEASIADDWISGFNFSPDRQVRIRIYAAEGGSLLADVFVNAWGDTQLYADYGTHGVDLQAGMYILAEDLETGKKSELTLVHLTFDGVDYDTNIGWGTADPDAKVIVRANHLFDSCEITAIATGGNWSADFSTCGVVIDSGWDIRAMVFDLEFDATVANAPQPPEFSASLSDDWVNGNNWTPNNTVTIRRYEYENGPAVGNPIIWDTDNYGNFNADLRSRGIDLLPGNHITVTDTHSGVVKTLTLPNLTIDYLDPELDIAGGQAPADTRLSIDFNNQLESVQFDMFSESDGTWEANFAAYDFDLRPGSSGNVSITDEDGDRVQVDGRVLTPYVEASPNSNWVHAREWPIGTEMTLTINDPNTPQPVDYTATATMAQAPWNPGDPNDIVADFDLQGYDVKAGDVITTTGNSIGKTLTVSQLEVTDLDLENDLISGKGTFNVPIQVCASTPNKCITRWVTPDTSGDWTVNYHDLGTGNDDPDTFDVKNGSNGWAAEYDNDSDITWYDWRAPNPTIGVRANDNKVEGWEWPLGVTVTVTVDDPATPDVDPDITQFANVYEAPWNPGEFRFDLDLNGVIDIQPGFLVTTSYGDITKELIVSDFRITGYDLDADTVEGVAGSSQYVNVWTCWQNDPCIGRDETADENGDWSTNFGDPGEQNWEEQTADLRPGSWIDSSVSDEDGDQTMFGMNIKNPFIIVFPENEAVEGWEWPDGTTVNLTIDDPATPQAVDFAREGVMAVTTRGDPRTYIRFDFADEYDLKVDDVVTITGEVTPRTHVVLNLSLTTINPMTDTITGQAEPGANVILWPHEFDQVATVYTTAGPDGAWTADFTDLFDLVAGTGGRSEILDEAGNATAVDWNVPFNQPPVADAGADRIAFAGETITLDASASSDPEAGALTYAWDLDNDGLYDDASGVTTAVSFSQPGEHISGLQVTDDGGLSGTDTVTITVLAWTLKGFYQPVDMNEIFNVVKGGNTVPFKFELFAGTTELTDVADVLNFISIPIACESNAPVDTIETTVTGGTSLHYDTAAGQFIYNWKTPKNPGKCYRVTMTTIDGSSLVAYFKLK